MQITPEEIDELMPEVMALPDVPEYLRLLIPVFDIVFPFDTDRLKEFEPQIRALLDRVSPEFLETDGRGSRVDRFPCLDSPVVGPRKEALIAMGLAVGKIKWLVPRESWETVFPDGLPYLVVVAEPGQYVPPLPVAPAAGVAGNIAGLVPWVTSQPARLYERAKKLVKVKVRHTKPKR